MPRVAIFHPTKSLEGDRIECDIQFLQEDGLEAVDEQVVRLLGPHRVNFDTAGFQTDPGYFVGTTLTAGDIIVSAWLEGVDSFDTAGAGDFVSINLCTAADPSGTYMSPVFYDLNGATQNLPGTVFVEQLTDRAHVDSRLPGRVTQDAQLRVAGFFSNPPTQGTVDLYVLVSEST